MKSPGQARWLQTWLGPEDSSAMLPKFCLYLSAQQPSRGGKRRPLPVLVSHEAQWARQETSSGVGYLSVLGPINPTRVQRPLTDLVPVIWSPPWPAQDGGRGEGMRSVPLKAHGLNGLLWNEERVTPQRQGCWLSKGRHFTQSLHWAFLPSSLEDPSAPPYAKAQLFPKASLPTWLPGTSLASTTSLKRIQS